MKKFIEEVMHVRVVMSFLLLSESINDALISRRSGRYALRSVGPLGRKCLGRNWTGVWSVLSWQGDTL